MKIIGRGAEAITYVNEQGFLVKKRESKKYRLKILDDKIIKTRTKKEVKLLKKLEKHTPKVITSNETEIVMEYLSGVLLKEIIDKEPELCKEVGKIISYMHDTNIVHGDLTTSNIIKKNNDELKLIDLGLGKVSKRYEDKAVDLHLFKESLISKHHKIFNKAWTFFIENYNPEEKDKIITRLNEVELRGRNKKK